MREENERKRLEEEQRKKEQHTGDRMFTTNDLNRLTRTAVRDRQPKYDQEYNRLINKLK